MGSKSITLLGVALILLMAGKLHLPQSSPASDRRLVLNSPVDEKTAVRFFYDPAGDYFHVPLIFRGVGHGDPLLDTAPMSAEGRTAFVSLAEMRQLTEALARSGLAWQESESTAVLGSYKALPVSNDMEVLIAYSKAKAVARIPAASICKTLEPLDSALKSPRGLWEFQGFRLNYDCKVAGFKKNAYPDH